MRRRSPVVPLVVMALLGLAAVPVFAAPLGGPRALADRVIAEALSEYAASGTINGVPLTLQQFDANADVCPPQRERAEAEERALIAEGRRLFSSRNDWGQQPSLGPTGDIFGQRLSCADCHAGPAFSDNRTRLVGPTEYRALVPRQTPHLLRQLDPGSFGWDGRFGCIQAAVKAAIQSPLEMRASREPIQRELDALAAFVATLDAPDAVAGADFDPALAERGEALFNLPRGRDPFGRSFPGERISCATCHTALNNFSDNDFHIVMFPLFLAPELEPIDPSHQRDGKVLGFNTPVLRGLRFTAPYFHDGLLGHPSGEAPLRNEPADLALLQLVTFYSQRFEFGFTLAEQLAIVEFLKSL